MKSQSSIFQKRKSGAGFTQYRKFDKNSAQQNFFGIASQISHTGFTLTEVMVAILVLTTGIAAVLQIFPIGFSVERANQMRTQASLLAQGKVESLYFQGYEGIAMGTVSEPQLETPFGLFSRTTTVTYVSADLQEVGDDRGLKKIEVVVSWQAALQLGAKNVTIVTLVAKR